MGQRSGRNRSQAGVSQRSHKRSRITGSSAKEVGGDEKEVRGRGGCGGPVFSIRNMHEREGVFSSFLTLLTSRRLRPCGLAYDPYPSYPFIWLHGPPPPACQVLALLSGEERLTGDG